MRYYTTALGRRDAKRSAFCDDENSRRSQFRDVLEFVHDAYGVGKISIWRSHEKLLRLFLSSCKREIRDFLLVSLDAENQFVCGNLKSIDIAVPQLSLFVNNHHGPALDIVRAQKIADSNDHYALAGRSHRENISRLADAV